MNPMTASEYVKLAAVPENKDWETIRLRLSGLSESHVQLVHATLGLVTESGELADVIKRQAIYGKEVDVQNVIEELGDVLWYVALACRAVDVSMEQVMAGNIAKLSARYPDKFKEQDALNRDTVAEMASMDKAVHNMTIEPGKTVSTGRNLHKFMVAMTHRDYIEIHHPGFWAQTESFADGGLTVKPGDYVQFLCGEEQILDTVVVEVLPPGSKLDPSKTSDKTTCHENFMNWWRLVLDRKLLTKG